MVDVQAPLPAAARRVPHLSAALAGAKLLDFALYVLLARWLTIEDFGRYTFAVSFTLLFMMLADLGLSSAFARRVMQAGSSRNTSFASLLRVSLVLKLALAVATVAATMVIARHAGLSLELVAMISAVTGGMLIHSGATLFDALLMARQRSGASGLAMFGHSASGLAFAGLLLGFGLGVQAAALAYLCAAVVHASLSVWRSRDLWIDGGESEEEPRSAHVQEAAGLLRDALPVALPGVFVALYFRIDVVMLYFMEGESAVGFYAGAYGLFEVLLPLSAAYRVMFVAPSLRSGDGSGETLRILSRRSLQALLLLTVGIAAFVSIEASSVLDALIGPHYVPASLTLAILIWGLPAAFLADLLHHLLHSGRRQLAGTLVVAIVAALNVGLNWLVIPAFSFTGAAAVTVVSEMVCFAGLLYLLSRDAPDIAAVASGWRPVLAGVLLAVVLTTVGAEFPPDVVRLILAGIGGVALTMLVVTASGRARRDDPRDAAGSPERVAREGRSGADDEAA